MPNSDSRAARGRLLVLPLLVLFTFIIPDVRRSGPGKYYYASFVLSILWIGVSSFFMISWVEII